MGCVPSQPSAQEAALPDARKEARAERVQRTAPRAEDNSRQDVPSAEKPIEPGAVVGRVFQRATAVGGVQFYPSAAAFAVYERLRAFNRVVVTGEHIFACLFEGYGGAESAHYLHRSAYACFCSALKRRDGDMEAALRLMLVDMEEALLHTSKAAPNKAATGAGAVIAVVNMKSLQLHGATVGGCVCLVTRATGSATRAATEAIMVADGRKARSAIHGVRWMKPPDGKALHAGRAHVMGFGIGKSTLMADAYARVTRAAPIAVAKPCPQLKFEVGTHALLAEDEHVLLLSSGFLDLVPCCDAALMATNFNAHEMQMAIDAAGRNAEPPLARTTHDYGDAELPVPDYYPSAKPPGEAQTFNSSEMLVRYARARLDNDSVKAPPGMPVLLSDVAVVCVGVEFPTSAASSQAQLAKTSSRESIDRQPIGEPSRHRSPKVTYRWYLVRQYVSFLIHRKRAFYQAWWETRSGALALASRQARAAELVAYQHSKQAAEVANPGLSTRQGHHHRRHGATSPGRSPNGLQAGAAGGHRQRKPTGQSRRAAANQTPIRHYDMKARAMGRQSPMGGSPEAGGTQLLQQYHHTRSLESGLARNASWERSSGDEARLASRSQPVLPTDLTAEQDEVHVHVLEGDDVVTPLVTPREHSDAAKKPGESYSTYVNDSFDSSPGLGPGQLSNPSTPVTMLALPPVAAVPGPPSAAAPAAAAAAPLAAAAAGAAPADTSSSIPAARPQAAAPAPLLLPSGSTSAAVTRWQPINAAPAPTPAAAAAAAPAPTPAAVPVAVAKWQAAAAALTTNPSGRRVPMLAAAWEQRTSSSNGFLNSDFQPDE